MSQIYKWQKVNPGWLELKENKHLQTKKLEMQPLKVRAEVHLKVCSKTLEIINSEEGKQMFVANHKAYHSEDVYAHGQK
jgi:hypothetical protein